MSIGNGDVNGDFTGNFAVCHSWHKISKDPELWRYTDSDLVEMTKNAIDRSCGQLIDLKIASFGCDDLLIHLSNRWIATRIILTCLELVGRHCPGLKSLTFNQNGMFHEYESENEEAFAIARSMPELRHLSLFENPMSNNGLQAILYSCHHLESLDIRQCFSVKLVDCELSKICSSIKRLRDPHDCIDDYEFKFDSCILSTEPYHDFVSFEHSFM
ncbi:putative F-box/LRR-repeat protein 23 [Impatiens glandulifera]|uniref:putative F-box/LRR-repeat protein 23 n=1 Tax=Impatiens glandulifera TaxID=253017 RepID=UPI001FB15742|nr:putative F-box/LRR-repeat protein 23 [Impatiens glandulifera]